MRFNTHLLLSLSALAAVAIGIFLYNWNTKKDIIDKNDDASQQQMDEIRIAFLIRRLENASTEDEQYFAAVALRYVLEHQKPRFIEIKLLDKSLKEVPYRISYYDVSNKPMLAEIHFAIPNSSVTIKQINLKSNKVLDELFMQIE